MSGLVSLTAIWREAGSIPRLAPSNWRRGAGNIIRRVANQGDHSPETMILSRRGNQGGMWVIPSLAREYQVYLERSINRINSVVYFVACDELKLVKIGVTRRLKTRITTLAVDCPLSVRLLCTVPGGVALEKELHSRFEAFRFRGEWFRYAEPIQRLVFQHLNASNDHHPAEAS